MAEQLEALNAKIAEAVGLMEKAAKATEGQKAELKEYVGTLVKEALAAHPGATETKIEFAEGVTKEAQILAKMPGDVKTALDNAFILSKVLQRPANTTKYWTEEVSPRLGDIQKALSVAAGKGTEWVPTDFSSQLYEFVRLETKVWQLFPSVNMPTNPYVLPVQVGRMQTYKHPEQTANTGQTLTTLGDPTTFSGSTTLTAKDHVGAVLMSKNVEEDSIIPVLPLVQRDIITGLAEGREDAIVNGDSAGTHEDSDIGAGVADSRRRLWLGLRASANDNSYKTDLGTLSLATLRSLRGAMGKYGVNPRRLALIVGIQGYIKLIGLDQVTTVQNYGAGATVLSGELGNIDGIPIIVSEWIREDLNASGVYDGVTSDNTVLNLVYRDGFVTGEKRGADIQILRELYARSRQDAIQVTERIDFEAIYATAANKTNWLGYNIAV